MIKVSTTFIFSFLLIGSVYSQNGVWLRSYKYNCQSPEKIKKTYNSGNVFVLSKDSVFAVDINKSNSEKVVLLSAKFTQEGSVYKVDKSMFGFSWEFSWKDESNFIVQQNNECHNYTFVNTTDRKKVNSKLLRKIYENFYLISTNIDELNYDFKSDTISFKNDTYSKEFLFKNIDSRVFEIEGRLFMSAFLIRPSIYPIVGLDKKSFKLESFGEENEIIEFNSIKISQPREKEKKAFNEGRILIDE